MLDIFAEYATDDTLENEGTLMEVGDAKFLVARAGNRKYVRLLSKAFERNQKALDRKDDAADKLSDLIMIDVLAGSILLGWEGDVGYQGKPLPYSQENAKMLLAIKDFRKLVLELANDFSSFKLEQEKAQGEG